MNESTVNESVVTRGTDIMMKKDIKASGGPPRIFVPDVLANWPWTSRIHPDYAEIKEEEDIWLSGFQMFSTKSQDAFDRCKICLCTCLFYPHLSKESAKRVGKFNQLCFLFEECSNDSTPSEVCDQRDILVDVFHNPHTPRPKGEWVGGEMTRQFWQTHMKNTTEDYQKALLQELLVWFEALKQESIDRQDHRFLDIRTCLEKHVQSGAMRLTFFLSEPEQGIPEEIKSHPAIQGIVLLFSQIGIFCNDILSYNVEQMRGDELYNTITYVMNEHDTDVNGAMLWVQDHISELTAKLFAAMASLPQWEEPLDSKAKEYCDYLGQIIRGNWDWAFESERYFGNKGPEIKKNKWMSLLPKKLGGKEAGPAHVDGALL